MKIYNIIWTIISGLLALSVSFLFDLFIVIAVSIVIAIFRFDVPKNTILGQTINKSENQIFIGVLILLCMFSLILTVIFSKKGYFYAEKMVKEGRIEELKQKVKNWSIVVVILLLVCLGFAWRFLL